jgi:hypothetical protein
MFPFNNAKMPKYDKQWAWPTPWKLNIEEIWQEHIF